MRNLKKVLALVLALVMSLSLVTIANAADFSDNADIDYSEAVDVMVAAGIIDGVGNNSFDPNGTLTREQAAKLITYMLLGENSDNLGVESSSFNDVAATRWSAPAIEYCATMGIIDGAGDGNFYPAGKRCPPRCCSPLWAMTASARATPAPAGPSMWPPRPSARMCG